MNDGPTHIEEVDDDDELYTLPGHVSIINNNKRTDELAALRTLLQVYLQFKDCHEHANKFPFLFGLLLFFWYAHIVR